MSHLTIDRHDHRIEKRKFLKRTPLKMQNYSLLS